MKIILLLGLLWIAVPPMPTVKAGEWKDHLASVLLAAYIGYKFRELKTNVQP